MQKTFKRTSLALGLAAAALVIFGQVESATAALEDGAVRAGGATVATFGNGAYRVAANATGETAPFASDASDTGVVRTGGATVQTHGNGAYNAAPAAQSSTVGGVAASVEVFGRK